MQITFNIQYKTVFGEELLLNIVGGEAGDRTIAMSTADGLTWTCQIEAKKSEKRVDYFYSVRNCCGIKCSEWKTITHRLDLNTKASQHIIVEDIWHEIPGDTYLYSSAFTDCVNRRAEGSVKPLAYDKALRLVVRAPQLHSGARLALTGKGAVLGNWDLKKALHMTEHNHNEWIVDIDGDALNTNEKEVGLGNNNKICSKLVHELEFKFVAFSDKGDEMWETCENRTLTLKPLEQNEVRVVALDQSFYALCDEKVAGTLIPVFSLRSEGSFGVGDFGDLKLMVDWMAKTHQRLLQVLPINDSTSTHTWTDSYPYSCISIFALHPQYADLRQLPALNDKLEADRFEVLREELNALPQIDYERVNNAKLKYLRLLFEQEGKKVLASKEFKAFFADCERWLAPYAHYCYLRDFYGTCVFSEWPDHKQWNEADRKALSNPKSELYNKVAFYYYMQFVLDQQMRSAHEYARARGVILKGDIPIGVNRNGCDVWHEPEYFHLDSQAGAPPDAFSVNGQNWGLPTYNWDRMIADGCEWWVRRFQNMAKYFDAYRIDHVLGFFRIWDIPVDCVHGLLGQFSPALPMTKAEIGSYGFEFDEERHTRPFINKWVLERIFGERADEVAQNYLQPIAEDGTFSMRPEYDTERKVQAAFAGKNSAADTALRDGLYKLIENVLFVRDRKRNYLYHPRITAHLTFAYAALSDDDKQRFYRLYDDFYYRRHNMFWYREAMKKLPRLVQATRMLVCAEDLGMVPESVDWVMKDLRILSLNVQTMPKEYGVRFADLSKYPYRSVCLFSSHDMPTLRLWWDEDKEVAQDYYESVLYHTGAAPHPLPGWLAREIIVRQMQTPSMLCIVQLQDWLATDERIRQADPTDERVNVPANPFHYWRYRMPMTIESLKADRDFVNSIKDIVDETGRY